MTPKFFGQSDTWYNMYEQLGGDRRGHNQR